MSETHKEAPWKVEDYKHKRNKREDSGRDEDARGIMQTTKEDEGKIKQLNNDQTQLYKIMADATKHFKEKYNKKLHQQ